jgi:hypothetical protein
MRLLQELAMSLHNNAHQREVYAIQNRVLSRMMPVDRETSMAMELIVVASQIGTNVSRLARSTGFSVEQIRPFAKRLREVKLWEGNTADVTEWLDLFDHRQRMTIILAQALVARGLLERVSDGETVIYHDKSGNLMAGVSITRRFVGCLDTLMQFNSQNQLLTR